MRSMKTALLALTVLGIVGIASAQGNRGTAEATVSGATITIDYGRPMLQGRDMLGKAPPGTVWRMGMNEATVLETEGDLVFGDVTIPQGSYSLWAKRVDEKTWHLVFNEQTGQWGTQHDATQDLAEVPLEWSKLDESTEQFTIELADSGTFRMVWGNDVLTAPFEVK